MPITHDEMNEVIDKLKRRFPGEGVIVLVLSGDGATSWGTNLTTEQLTFHLKRTIKNIEANELPTLQ